MNCELGKRATGKETISVISSIILVGSAKQEVLNVSKDIGDEWGYCTLDELFEFVTLFMEGKEPSLITVIYEEPLKGIVYRYGNNGRFWEKVGVTCGYA